METWIPNSDPEIIKLSSLYSTQRQYWLTRLQKLTGLYNVAENYAVYIADHIASQITTPLTTNRYSFNSKVTFEIPVLYIKAVMNVSGNKSNEYGIHVTPKITSIIFVENRTTKQCHFKLEIKNNYDLYNPGAGTTQTDYRFDIKGFKNPTVSINFLETKEYYYQTFTFNTKEISFSNTISTDPIIPISQDPVETNSTLSSSPLSIGDSHVNFDLQPKTRQINWKSKVMKFFKRKEDKNGNLK